METGLTQIHGDQWREHGSIRWAINRSENFVRLGTNVPERKHNQITLTIGERYDIIKTNGASALLSKRKLDDLVVHQKKKKYPMNIYRI